MTWFRLQCRRDAVAWRHAHPCLVPVGFPMSGGAMTTLSLTAEDRCDRCGAQAATRVVLEQGDLLFCNHHARQYGFTDRLPQPSGASSAPAGE